MHHYKKLEVWNDSMDLVESIYKLVANFPSDEKFGLKTQLTRAVVSIPSNIAEGAGRNSNKEFSQYLNIATGSAFEVETQVLIAIRMKFINEKDAETTLELIDKVQKKLFRLKQNLIN